MPQTRFVLKKALELGQTVVVVVNKVDRPSARPDYVVNTTFELFVELNASDEQVCIPTCTFRSILGYWEFLFFAISLAFSHFSFHCMELRDLSRPALLDSEPCYRYQIFL